MKVSFVATFQALIEGVLISARHHRIIITDSECAWTIQHAKATNPDLGSELKPSLGLPRKPRLLKLSLIVDSLIRSLESLIKLMIKWSSAIQDAEVSKPGLGYNSLDMLK